MLILYTPRALLGGSGFPSLDIRNRNFTTYTTLPSRLQLHCHLSLNYQSDLSPLLRSKRAGVDPCDECPASGNRGVFLGFQGWLRGSRPLRPSQMDHLTGQPQTLFRFISRFDFSRTIARHSTGSPVAMLCPRCLDRHVEAGSSSRPVVDAIATSQPHSPGNQSCKRRSNVCGCARCPLPSMPVPILRARGALKFAVVIGLHRRGRRAVRNRELGRG